MLKRFLALMMLLALMCAVSSADVLYLDFSTDNNDYISEIHRVRLDSSGNMTTVYGIDRKNLEDTFSNFYAVNVNSKDIILTFDDPDTKNHSYDGEDRIKICIYDPDDLTKPTISKIFTYSQLPYDYDMRPEVWKNNLIFPCKDNTIVEINPQDLSIVSSYTYPEKDGLRHYLTSRVQIFIGKIYAMFYVWPFKHNAVHVSSLRASDSEGDSYEDFAEMDRTGHITSDLKQLDPIITSDRSSESASEDQYVDGKKAYRRFLNMYSVDDKLYVISALRFIETGDSEYCMYCFSGNINFESAGKIILPKNIAVKEICTDGNGGLYISANEYEENMIVLGLIDLTMPPEVKSAAIYHYDGKNVSRVYGITVTNEAYKPGISSMKYDRQNNILIASVVNTGWVGKLTFFKPGTTGNLQVIREINNVMCFDVTENSSSSSPDGGNNSEPNTPPDNGGNNSEPNTPPDNGRNPVVNPNPNDPSYDYDDYYDYYDHDGRETGRSSGGGGCDSGFGIIGLALCILPSFRRK